MPRILSPAIIFIFLSFNKEPPPYGFGALINITSPTMNGSLPCVSTSNITLRADSRIRSQDRGRRGARPARREEGEYIDVFNRRATQQAGMDRRPNPEVIFESALINENSAAVDDPGVAVSVGCGHFQQMGTWCKDTGVEGTLETCVFTV
jgi:hypothetical protein